MEGPADAREEQLGAHASQPEEPEDVKEDSAATGAAMIGTSRPSAGAANAQPSTSTHQSDGSTGDDRQGQVAQPGGSKEASVGGSQPAVKEAAQGPAHDAAQRPAHDAAQGPAHEVAQGPAHDAAEGPAEGPAHEASAAAEGSKPKLPKPEGVQPCPRCSSRDTKFCYYNNYNIKQPRYYCRACQRYWTAGGSLRDIPIGAGRRKSKAAQKQEPAGRADSAAGPAAAAAANGGGGGGAAALPPLSAAAAELGPVPLLQPLPAFGGGMDLGALPPPLAQAGPPFGPFGMPLPGGPLPQAGLYGPLGLPGDPAAAAAAAAAAGLPLPGAAAAAGAPPLGEPPGLPAAVVAAALGDSLGSKLSKASAIQSNPASSAFAAVLRPAPQGGMGPSSSPQVAPMLGFAAGGGLASLAGSPHTAALLGGPLPAEDGAVDGRRMRQKVEAPGASTGLLQLPPSSSPTLLSHPAMSALATLAAAAQGGGAGGGGGLAAPPPGNAFGASLFGGAGAALGQNGAQLGTSGPLSSEFFAAAAAAAAQVQPGAMPLAGAGGGLPYAQHHLYAAGGSWPYGLAGSFASQGWAGGYDLGAQASYQRYSAGFGGLQPGGIAAVPTATGLGLPGLGPSMGLGQPSMAPAGMAAAQMPSCMGLPTAPVPWPGSSEASLGWGALPGSASLAGQLNPMVPSASFTYQHQHQQLLQQQLNPYLGAGRAGLGLGMLPGAAPANPLKVAALQASAPSPEGGVPA